MVPIVLKCLKTDFYEKGGNLVVASLYVKDVSSHTIQLDEEQVSVSFVTRNASFLKIHGDAVEEDTCFSYTFQPRGRIVPEESRCIVKKSLIELVLKKAEAVKWGSLEKLTYSAKQSPLLASSEQSPSQATSESASCFPSSHTEMTPKKKSTKKVTFDTDSSDACDADKSPSPRKSPQLLGGKSTPLTKKGSEDVRKRADTEVAPSNQTSSSSSADQRNIQKSAIVQVEQAVGLTGLENYANNCYMNVVLQVLANIQELRDYFKGDLYVGDIATNNPLSSSGKVVKAFADVIKALWISGKKAFKPHALKNIMGRQCTLFMGWQQHDAQEFCASLLDNLHEDLNRAYFTEKPAVCESKDDGEGPTVNEKPDTAWAAHIKRNNSMLVKLFHGQLVSKITCASCHKTSYSYDPCSQISIPIPSSKKVVHVLVFSRDAETVPKKVRLQISTPNAQVWHLVNMLQSQIGIAAHLMAVFRGYTELCEDIKLPLTAVTNAQYVVVSEIAAMDEVDYFSIPIFQYTSNPGTFLACALCGRSSIEVGCKLKRCTRCLCAAYCSRDCQTKHWPIHSKVCVKGAKNQVGLPFCVTVSREGLTYNSLESLIRAYAAFSIEVPLTHEKAAGAVNRSDSVDSDAADNTGSSERKISSENLAKSHDLHQCSCVLKLSNNGNKNTEDLYVLTSENFTIEKILKASCVIVEWQTSLAEDADEKSIHICSRQEPIHECDQEGDEDLASNVEEEKCSLQDCLKLFMEPERLDESESWKCSKCRNLQSAKKEMAISFPPAMLTLHMKRFSFGEYGQKISKSVTYPLSNFDLTPYVARETRNKIDYPLLYDLCGVICHRGTMRMGHYTCMVRLINQKDEEEVGWRFFDDDEVVKIKEDKVVCHDAYVLVYRLRGTNQMLKSERPFPAAILTHPSVSPGSTPHTKRRHAESVSAVERPSSSLEQRSHGEQSYSRIKRSVSIESGVKGIGSSSAEFDNQEDSSYTLYRRSNSASLPKRRTASAEEKGSPIAKSESATDLTSHADDGVESSGSGMFQDADSSMPAGAQADPSFHEAAFSALSSSDQESSSVFDSISSSFDYLNLDNIELSSENLSRSESVLFTPRADFNLLPTVSPDEVPLIMDDDDDSENEWVSADELLPSDCDEDTQVTELSESACSVDNRNSNLFQKITRSTDSSVTTLSAVSSACLLLSAEDISECDLD